MSGRILFRIGGIYNPLTPIPKSVHLLFRTPSNYSFIFLGTLNNLFSSFRGRGINKRSKYNPIRKTPENPTRTEDHHRKIGLKEAENHHPP